jgi:Glycosyltransferase family 87
MISGYRKGLLCVLLCCGVSILWGVSIGRARSGWIDFRAVYAGTRCLIHHHNPYDMGDLEREYMSEEGQRPPGKAEYFQAVVLYVNLPTTFVFVAPFALLSWGLAHTLWTLLTISAFGLSILLMWSAGARYSLHVSTFLACAIAVNCQSIFAGGNTAGIIVGLCGIAVWCFLENRFAWIGILCLGLSLAIKPHDAGLIWLYFVLAGGAYRKRALESLAITAAIGLVAVLWVSHVAPHWMQDWNANLAKISAPGGINDPGPDSVTGRSIYTVVDLQATISIFRDDPRFYNTVSYLCCGALLFAWFIRTLRTRITVSGAWLALAAVTAFTMLITYHRPWDARLTMLAIPPCCMLWAGQDRLAKVALTVTAAAALFAGDVPLAAFKTLADSLHTNTAGLGNQLLTLVLRRPEPIALMAMGGVYLWIYVRQRDLRIEKQPDSNCMS